MFNLKNLSFFFIGIIIGLIPFFVFVNDQSFRENTEAIHPTKEIRDELRYLESSLDSLHQISGNPLPGEWLYSNREIYQSPERFLEHHPNILSEKRNKVYLQPIGGFSEKQMEVLTITAEYLEVFYNVEVLLLDSITVKDVPTTQRRENFGYYQINCTYILDKMLKPKLPEDAVAYMGFTALDLYPNDNYNFVFGQGKLGGQLGIFSLARYGDPDESDTAFQNCLSRTLKVASHELGHIFSITHCVKYECVMNGSNSLYESDSKPQFLCPIDLLKVSKSLYIDIKDRYKKLAAFWEKYGFDSNATFCRKSIEALDLNLGRKYGGKW